MSSACTREWRACARTCRACARTWRGHARLISDPCSLREVPTPRIGLPPPARDNPVALPGPSAGDHAWRSAANLIGPRTADRMGPAFAPAAGERGSARGSITRQATRTSTTPTPDAKPRWRRCVVAGRSRPDRAVLDRAAQRAVGPGGRSARGGPGCARGAIGASERNRLRHDHRRPRDLCGPAAQRTHVAVSRRGSRFDEFDDAPGGGRSSFGCEPRCQICARRWTMS
jgi:hypothetical protein